jgi:biofilm PGA synthesis protein PgaA
MASFHNVAAVCLRRHLMYGLRCGVVLIGFAIAATAIAGMRERQDEAANLARTGQYEEALAKVSQLRVDYPDEVTLLYDEVVVLAWAGYPERAVAAAANLDAGETPAWVALAVGKAARDMQQFDTAVEWYESATKNDPGNLDARLGLAMALADSGRAADARAALKKTPQSEQNKPPVLMTSAYLFQREGLFLPAVSEYDKVLKGYPDNHEALRGKAYALQALLLPDEAMRVVEGHRHAFTDEDVVRLQSDALALELRRAIRTPNRTYPYTSINSALAHIDAALEEAPPGSPLALQLQYDRIVGQSEAYRTLEAINNYEALLEQGVEPPAYVHFAAARSYLYRERPEEAMEALLIAEQLAPNDLEIQIEKFYAYVDLDQHAEAIALADSIVVSLEPVNQEDNSKVVRPNETRTRARIIAGMGRAYAGQLEDAQQRIDQLLTEAPNNIDARYSLGNIYLYRGWQDRPLPEYSQALTMDPRLLPARTNYAQAQISRQEYPEAESELRSVQPLYPSDKAVMNLNERWILYNSWQLVANVRWGESSGDAFGSDQHEVDAWLFTTPVKDNYRFFLRTFDNYAVFVDGTWARRRTGLGAEYRKGVWTMRGDVNWNRSESGDAGFAGRADYRINDQWKVGGALEINSYITQLRADRAGIKSNLLVGDVSYIRDELYSAGAGASLQRYDDGNNHLNAFGTSRLRLYNGYTYQLDGLANAGYTTNSKSGTDVPYFAPERAIEGMIGVENIWRQYRRYDKALTHRLIGNAGMYNQKNFGSDPIWTLAYQLSWSINESVDLNGGASRGRRYYDGGGEDQTFFNIQFNARFQ